MIRALRQHFCAGTRTALESSGLRQGIRDFLTNGDVDVDVILLMQAIDRSSNCQVRSIPLTRYTTQSGNDILITVGSIIDAMTNDSHFFFQRARVQTSHLYTTAKSTLRCASKDDFIVGDTQIA